MQMKEKKTSVFEIESIPKAVAVLAIPSVLSMLVTVLYNMVDTVFVGQTHDPYQMNAVSMATPVFMILMARQPVRHRAAAPLPPVLWAHGNMNG